MATRDRPRLSANTGFLWKELPFLERIAAAGRAGFDAVEFHDEWRRESADDVRAALREAGRGGSPLPLLGLNARMGETAGCAAIPGDEEGAWEDAVEAIEAAAALGAGAVHLLAGKMKRTEETMATYRANLARAADRAARTRPRSAPDGLTVLIEPLCAKAMPVYPLRTVAQAAAIIEGTLAPNLRVMFDIFHVHGQGDDISGTFREHARLVGHVQIADPETRGEPRTEGEHAIGPLLGEMRRAGYDRPFGAEYVPDASVEAGLGWMGSL